MSAPILVVGFTGTQWPLTEKQKNTLADGMVGFREGGSVWMLNGDCIGADKCPGCGAPMDADQSVCAEFVIESFTCRVETCGWHYDADRFDANDEPWGEYDGW